jgi:hypothetical protein
MQAHATAIWAVMHACSAQIVSSTEIRCSLTLNTSAVSCGAAAVWCGAAIDPLLACAAADWGAAAATGTDGGACIYTGGAVNACAGAEAGASTAAVDVGTMHALATATCSLASHCCCSACCSCTLAPSRLASCPLTIGDMGCSDISAGYTTACTQLIARESGSCCLCSCLCSCCSLSLCCSHCSRCCCCGVLLAAAGTAVGTSLQLSVRCAPVCSQLSSSCCCRAC